MKKALVVTSALLLTGIFAAPGLVGIQTKTSLDSMIDRFNQSPDFQVSWESYDKSWFGAEGVINTHVSFTPSPGEDPFVFDVQSRVSVKHGPVILGDRLQFAWAAWNSEVINSDELTAALQLGNQSIYSQVGRFSYLGDASFDESAPAFTYTNDDLSVEFGGYQAKGLLKGDQLDYQGRVEQVLINMNDWPVPVEVKGFALSIDSSIPEQEFTSGDLLPGEFSVKLDGLYAGTEFLADDLEMAADVSLREGDTLADLTARYSAARIQTKDFQLTNADMEIAILNYSAAFNKAYTEVLQTSIMNAKTQEQAGALLTDFMSKNVDKLLSTKPELQISKIAFTLPEGTFNSRVNIKLADYQIDANQLSNPAFWQSNLNVDAYADADKMLANKLATLAAVSSMGDTGQSRSSKERMGAEQAEMMLGILTQSGMLAEKDGRLVAEMSVQNGEATVNGQPIPLPGR